MSVPFIDFQQQNQLIRGEVDIGIKKVFDKDAYRIPISSIKSMIGHTIGAAGAIQAVACCLILQKKIIPPTINLYQPDPLCDLDYVANKPREVDVETIISNSFGFGSNNAVLVIRRCK